MFVRENPSPAGGSRHVQVSSSDDGIGDWSSFRRLEFDGLHEVPHKENNIYFLTVRPFQLADGTEGLLGLMPANLNFTDHAHNLTSDTGWKQVSTPHAQAQLRTVALLVQRPSADTMAHSYDGTGARWRAVRIGQSRQARRPPVEPATETH